jgi:hypothetical protein
MIESIIKSQNFDIILKYANLLCPNKYNSKYDNQYYLLNIMYMLNDFVSWKSLKYSIHLKSNSIYHYKTIHKKHILWSDNLVYKYAYTEIINNDKINNITENLFIDNTLINNKYGSENIGYGGETKKKKFTLLTAVINENKKPVLIFNNKTNDKNIKLNNKNIQIQTLPHDTKSLLTTIKKLKNKVVKNTYIVGDKGFIINKDKITNKYITVITPKKINQKIKNTEDNKNKLKKRYTIENFFALLKNFNRINIRRDKLIKTYLGFVYLGCICIL